MLVLIATDPTPAHAHRAGGTDLAGAVDGELVTPPVVDCPDSRCEVCTTGWFGLVSHGATTTAMVVDRPGVTLADLKRRIHDWLDCGGVLDTVVQAVEAGEYEVDGQPFDDPVAAVDDIVMAHVHDIMQICAEFPVGTELSRLGTLVSPVARRVAA
ncbi:MAG: hypothetical protein ACLGHQ_02635 [Acidimicrobiia bacterium]